MITIRAPDGALWSPPVWVDFMSLDWDGRVRLDKPGTLHDLESWGIELTNGRMLVLYEEDGDTHGRVDDLVAVGKATLDAEEGRWVVEDWEPTVHVSDLDAESRKLYEERRPRSGQPI